MKLDIKLQESYSRGELLLRSIFGIFYIVLPHLFLLFFLQIISSVLTFISWWVILFTGSYPESFYEFQVSLFKWNLRLNARLFNLSDGYPAFGLNAEDENVTFEMPYPERLSRGTLLLKSFFGIFYVLLPHGFILIFRAIATQIVAFIAWWVVLFTGEFPESMHRFVVGTIRWNTRVQLYMGFMTDEYPPFSGQ